jgi:aminopeptidase-like protein/aminoglycoside N3'-acetyltransferase
MKEKIKDFIKSLINKGDIILLHSDVKKTCWLLKDFFSSYESVINFVIDSFLEALGEEGTLLIPTFNWDFCKGKPFDYKNSPAQTGLLPQIALQRKDFKRTKHPIYSFAVKGKLEDVFLSCDNISSFGIDSPFGLLWKLNGKIFLWDVNYQKSFTFAHFVEQIRNVSYRYEKFFQAPYIDENGKKEIKTYSMFVRNLEKGVITHLEPMGKILEDEGISKVKSFYGLKVRIMKAREAFERISLELKRNPTVLITFEKFKNFSLGQEMHDLARRLFPINRSITGKGFRKSLEIIKEYLPDLQIRSIKSGEKCFNWTVPLEWDIEEAYIEEYPSGKKIVDFKENNLHVVNYSISVDKILSFEELENHLYYRKDLPEAIPYVTSYYHPTWGFCISYNQYKTLDKTKKFHVVIRSKHFQGELNYAELIIPGKSDKEVFFSTYLCHPSLANDNLSGPVLATFLAKYLKQKQERRYTYRFVFIPETIGSICYLSRNLKHLKEKTIAGYVLTCVGDEGEFSYLPSRYGNTLADKVALNLLNYDSSVNGKFKKYTYLDRGSDERQYCAPDIDLPVCLVMKSKFGEYKEYHTSLDNLDFVTPKGLEESFNFYRKLIEVLENNKTYKVTVLCEPQMGKRGLYHKISHTGRKGFTKLLMDFLAYADGTNDLIDIANILKTSAYDLIEVANLLEKHNLIEEVNIY